MKNLELRKIILKLEDGTFNSWNPLDINRIEFHTNWIRINDEYINKEECYYNDWRGFIRKLCTLFEIDEFNNEK